MRTLIQNGTIVRSDRSFLGDLLIEDGRIAAIERGIAPADAEVVDATGCWVFPGFIDTHTHFDLDLGVTVTADDFITGTRAAVVGGTTTVLDFATQDRGMTMQDAFDRWQEKAAGSSCNYGFHMAISEWNAAREQELPAMRAQGVTSFKMYMVYDNMRLDDGAIYSALRAMEAQGCLAGVHCENYDLLQTRIRELKAQCRVTAAAHPLSRPDLLEAEAVARLMRIAELAKAPVWVVHLSTREGLLEALRARARGQEVYLETCPQYLLLTDACYQAPDAEKYVFSPPARSAGDNAALLNALGENEIDVIGTDHCSFTMAQKGLGRGDFSKIPNGGAGVQNRAELFYTYAVRTGVVTKEQMAGLLSENAAKIFGMYPRKGTLSVGADADVVVFDPQSPHTISAKTNLHNCDNSPFEGMESLGRARDVFVNGKRAVADGALVKPGAGRYVFRTPSERPRR